MRKDFAKNAGLAAVILLAPGGFVLGAALAADYLRKKRAEAATPATPPSESGTAPLPEPPAG